MRQVFITGGTGYIGRRLIQVLERRGHRITVVVREGSQGKLPPGRRDGLEGRKVIVADVLDRTTWEAHLRPSHTLVHLVGVAHPSPSKTLEFVDIDLRSAREAILAARDAQVEQFIYVSVAQPAPVMKPYIMVRAACENAIREAGLRATVLRPWYVLGPEHWWPLALMPLYKIAEVVPGISESAKRLGLVSLSDLTAALTDAVENPAPGMTILDVPAIRAVAKAFV